MLRKYSIQPFEKKNYTRVFVYKETGKLIILNRKQLFLVRQNSR